MLQPYFETYVLDSGNDHVESEFKQYPNIYYAGLFNEMKKLYSKKPYTWVGMIPSDIVLISSPEEFIKKINWLETTKNIGLWQPSLDESSRNWGGNIHSDKYEYESKKVLESHFLFISNEIMDKIDCINTNVNKLGFGIAEILSGISSKYNFGNVFDNNLLIHHPDKTGYDRKQAENESNKWVPSQCEKYELSLPYLKNIWSGHNALGEFKVQYKCNADKIIYDGKKEHPVFVSITSWKKRIKYVPEMINYLKKQTV